MRSIKNLKIDEVLNPCDSWTTVLVSFLDEENESFVWKIISFDDVLSKSQVESRISEIEKYIREQKV